MSVLARFEFERQKAKYKFSKLLEFVRMYQEWCRFFDKKVNELYAQKYGKV